MSDTMTTAEQIVELESLWKILHAAEAVGINKIAVFPSASRVKALDLVLSRLRQDEETPSIPLATVNDAYDRAKAAVAEAHQLAVSAFARLSIGGETLEAFASVPVASPVIGTEPRLSLTLQQARRCHSAMVKDHGEHGGDHACSRCFADADEMTGFRGFVCVKHILEDFIAPRIGSGHQPLSEASGDSAQEQSAKIESRDLSPSSARVEQELSVIQHCEAHWFTQGGTAQFGDVTGNHNADELISRILFLVRQGAARIATLEQARDTLTRERDDAQALAIQHAYADATANYEQGLADGQQQTIAQVRNIILTATIIFAESGAPLIRRDHLMAALNLLFAASPVPPEKG